MAKRRMTKAQREWCKKYESQSGFEPLMDGFYEGEESFIDAARRSVDWFEDWSVETMRVIDRYPEADEAKARRTGARR